jgi:uncharacterized protein HemY
MIGFLSSILVFILVFVILIIGVVFSFLRNLLGFNRGANRYHQDYNDTEATNTKKKNKIIDKSEGEYVDYEEIK